MRGGDPVDLREKLEFAALLLPAVTKARGTTCEERLGHRVQTVLGRHDGTLGDPEKDYSARYTFAEMCRLQGLPEDFLKHSPFTMAAKRKMIGNGVALMTGRNLARAIRAVLCEGLSPVKAAVT